MRTSTALFPFCGLGAGALGFLQAVSEDGPVHGFRSLGGIDLDAEACRDFETLTSSPALCADVWHLSPADVRRAFGERRPDVVFLSPPCKGASGLLSAEKARSEKYVQMNGLALAWVRLMLAAWPERPPLVLLENVPRLPTRAPEVIAQVRALLQGAGYAIAEGYHDCGELGGLAQHRRRYLLVARHERTVPALLYQPPRLRVRGCGEVLEQLPLPGDPAAGQLHALPRISWLNWVRLALIPAGGDWRDLEGVLAEGQARREQWARYGVADWREPVGTVAGSGSNGCFGVSDPRVQRAYDHGYAVLRWDQAAWTIAGKSSVGCGAYAVADPRLGYDTRRGTGRVTGWGEPVPTVTGQSGRPGHCSGGIVADPRLSCEPRAGAYGVLRWDAPAGTVTGAAGIDNGSFAVADPRLPPPSPVVIVAADGTWHRPLTLLELAALQGLPATVHGAPLTLAGKSRARWAERIGNAVPVGTARAIAGQMLRTLSAAVDGSLHLSSSAIWVQPEVLQ